MKYLFLLLALCAPLNAQVFKQNGGGAVAAGSIDTSKLASDSVTTAKILDGAVDTNKLAPDSVIGSKILTATIDTGKLNSTIQTQLEDIGGTGNCKTLYGSTVTVCGTGIVSAPSQVAAWVRTPSRAAVVGGAFTPIYWATVDKNNNGFFGPVATSSSTFTAPVGGAGGYLVTCSIAFAANAAGGAAAVVIYAASVSHYCQDQVNLATVHNISCTQLVDLSAGQTIQCYVEVAADQTIQTNVNSRFHAVKVY